MKPITGFFTGILRYGFKWWRICGHEYMAVKKHIDEWSGDERLYIVTLIENGLCWRDARKVDCLFGYRHKVNGYSFDSLDHRIPVFYFLNMTGRILIPGHLRAEYKLKFETEIKRYIAHRHEAITED